MLYHAFVNPYNPIEVYTAHVLTPGALVQENNDGILTVYNAEVKLTEYRAAPRDKPLVQFWYYMSHFVCYRSLERLLAEHPPKCPVKGSFMGWCRMHIDGAAAKRYPRDEVIIGLEIPAEARRTSNIIGACRCDLARIVRIKFGIFDIDDSITSVEVGGRTYRIGDTLRALRYDDDRTVPEAAGIKFVLDDMQLDFVFYDMAFARYVEIVRGAEE